MTNETLERANKLQQRITAVELDITRLKNLTPPIIRTPGGAGIGNVPQETNKIVKQICIASLEDLLASLKAEYEAL